MKKAHLILSTTALAAFGIFALTSLGSCNKKEQTCQPLYYGPNCEGQKRTSFVGTYVGNGTDNNGNTYTGWQYKFTAPGTNASHMTMVISRGGGIMPIELGITLLTDSTFVIENNATQTHQYAGKGTMNVGIVSINWQDISTPAGGPNTTISYTFPNLVIQ
jgi:hypothetical protein